MKAILFNTQPHLVSRSVGILFLWWFIDIGLFLAATYKNEKVIVLQQTKPISTIDSIPPKALNGGKELSNAGDTPVVKDSSTVTENSSSTTTTHNNPSNTVVNVEIVQP